MPGNLLDPLILDTIIYGPIQKGGASVDWGKLFSKLSFANFLNFLIPIGIILFIAFIVKLKWKQKQQSPTDTRMNLGI